MDMMIGEKKDEELKEKDVNKVEAQMKMRIRINMGI